MTVATPLPAAASRGTTEAPSARPSPTRVLVADRQPLFRDAIARAVRQRSQFQLVGEAGDGRTALALIRHHRPRVAVIDVRLPGISGHQVLNAVVRDDLPTRILLLAAAADRHSSYDAIAAGAAGWLSKAASGTQLCDAIDAVALGDMAMTPDVQTVIAAEIRRRSDEGQPLLDERERRVLELVAAGLSADEIGRELYLSTGTVKSILLRMYRRFGVSERAAAVAMALRQGLIQ